MTATVRAVRAPALGRFSRTERDAFDWCRHYAHRHDENFTVVSWFLPRALRPHLFAIYAFCRATDDLGDEAPGDRLALLDAWEADLRRCFAGERVAPLFVALGRTVETFAIPPDLFLRLIEANRIDQRRRRFETFDDLLGYCQYSATPVGRMVLHVLGYRDERRLRLADATCIGLQLANFWQDVAVDLAKGRIYLPHEEMRRFGCDEDSLRASRAGPELRRLLQFEVARAREFFARGRELEALVARSVRADVSLFRRGGEAVLDAIEAAGYDVLARRPRVSKRKKAWLALSLGVRMKLGL
jgi:squalene synthase HpnC